jgi:putative transposase
MPRPLRIHSPDGFYHVTLRGNHQQAIFAHDSERMLLNKIVARAIDKFRARLHAYCWMTNHLHLIVQISDLPLGKVVQQMASQYARAFQRTLDTTGHLFENRYHATLIDSDAYLLEALRYVHQNPVRARMAPDVSSYPWSSHRAYMRIDRDPFVTTDCALGLLSPDRARAIARYRAFVEELAPPAMAAELAALDSGEPLLGTVEFMARHSPTLRLSECLEATIAAACRHFGVTLSELRSPSRAARLVTARAWITHTALSSGAVKLAEVARALHRDEATLRSAIQNRNIRQEAEFSLPDTTNPAAGP